MDEQTNNNEIFKQSLNPYGIDKNLVGQLAKRMKVIIAIIILSVSLSLISLILGFVRTDTYSGYRYDSSFASVSAISSVVGFLIGLGISIAFIIYLKKSSQAFNSFQFTGDIRDLNDGFYHQNRYFNLSKALIIIAISLGGIALLISLISSMSKFSQ